ncbi:hypothetical protein HRbin34_00587 [bacterium HR34]|nr:hypothetical protein HRbin34_00587 [bacterium HR34]
MISGFKKVLFIVFLPPFLLFLFYGKSFAQDPSPACSENMIFNEMFQEAYIEYRGKKIGNNGTFGMYHGEEFNFIIEWKNTKKEHFKCFDVLRGRIMAYVEVGNGYVKIVPIEYFSNKEFLDENNDGIKDGVKIIYIIPYRFDIYDDNGNPVLGNFQAKVDIFLYEVFNPLAENGTKIYDRDGLASFNVEVRKPEFEYFEVLNDKIDFADNNNTNDYLEFKYKLKEPASGDDSYYIFYDVEGDSVYDVNQDKGTFSNYSEQTVRCDFKRDNSGKIEYECSGLFSIGPKTISHGSYTGTFFITLSNYEMKDGIYYLATEHKTIPFLVCDENYSCSFGGKDINPTSFVSLENFLKSISNTIFLVVILGASLMIVVGALIIMTAGGYERRLRQGKSIIKYAIIGVIIVLSINILYAFLQEIFSR